MRLFDVIAKEARSLQAKTILMNKSNHKDDRRGVASEFPPTFE
jgi:hypothetical protein